VVDVSARRPLVFRLEAGRQLTVELYILLRQCDDQLRLNDCAHHLLDFAEGHALELGVGVSLPGCLGVHLVDQILGECRGRVLLQAQQFAVLGTDLLGESGLS